MLPTCLGSWACLHWECLQSCARLWHFASSERGFGQDPRKRKCISHGSHVKKHPLEARAQDCNVEKAIWRSSHGPRHQSGQLVQSSDEAVGISSEQTHSLCKFLQHLLKPKTPCLCLLSCDKTKGEIKQPGRALQKQLQPQAYNNAPGL